MDWKTKHRIDKYRLIMHLADIELAVLMFAIIGTAGALECDTIGIGTAFLRVIVMGLLAIPCGYTVISLHNYYDAPENVDDRDSIYDDDAYDEYWDDYFKRETADPHGWLRDDSDR